MSKPHSPRLPLIQFGIAKLDAALREWHAAITRLQAIRGIAPAKVEDTGTGPVFSVELPVERYVKLTAALGSGAYTGVEVKPNAGGGFDALASPWSGTVKEYNATTGLPVTGAYVVRVRYFPASMDWRFQSGKCA